ncbi:MAG: protein kinase [Myxococcales bacterium]|nr:protein kinase [Myxococcales bacterium]
MRSETTRLLTLCAWAAALLLSSTAAVWAQNESAQPSLSLDDVSDETVGAEHPSETINEPGLAEATEDAFSRVRDAAKRDAASWARHTQQIKSDLLQNVQRGLGSLGRRPVETLDAWLAAANLPPTETSGPIAIASLIGLLGLMRLVRGRADLKVSIEYPAELRGTYSVKISRKKNSGRRGPHITSPSAAQRAKRKAAASSKSERQLVSRETDFHGIPSGRWFVTVDGFMQPQDDDTVIGTYFEEQPVKLHRGHTVRVDFDFHPKQCPVDVKVVWSQKPVQDALLAWRGHPQSLRYTRGGPVRIGIERGSQMLMVGSGDRVAEISIEVISFQPISVEVDLADRDHLLFTGCPPAVEPYLHGDMPAAARALEREGKSEVSNLILARLHIERDQRGAAARHYAEAGRPADAASIHRTLENYEKAADLYEAAGDLEEAAQMWRKADSPERAGELYERSREFESAAECFKQAGSVSKWVEMLERAGAPFEAAQVALNNGDTGRAIRSLQTLGPGEDDYVEAANLLVEVLQKEGHLDLATDKIEEIIRTQGAETVPLESCDTLATLLEDSKQFGRALDVLEIIRRRDATWPNLATRIEGLRKAQQQAQSRASGGGGGEFGDGFRYEILEEIGRGGMGIVFKARDRRLGREVALKRLPDNLRNHPKAVELFLREARACASLNHPNIVTVHDAGQEGDSFYITMELLQGRPLQKILKRNGKLGTKDAARLGIQVCKGLDYAHTNKIIHRDIKTANLFVTQTHVVKIMDFGLAKMVEEVRRASTVIGGTPYYMPPEQAMGEHVDARGDLYALGVTIFELLSGRVPFPEGDIAYHHRHTPVPDPRARGVEIPDAMVDLVLHLLAKEPDDRPASAEEVRERLQQIVESLA